MAHTKNKTKYWRRGSETVMFPQEVETVNEAGETVKSVVDMPFVLTGRNLKAYRQGGNNMRPLASTFLINLINKLNPVTIKADGANVPTMIESTETI